MHQPCVSELPLSETTGTPLPPDGGIEVLRVFLGWESGTYVILPDRYDYVWEIGDLLADVALAIAADGGFDDAEKDMTNDEVLAIIRQSFEQVLNRQSEQTKE
jgi:hypothetical protein